MAATADIQWPVPGMPGGVWQARAFGQTLDDLGVDLGAAAPFATTEVLRTCLSSAGAPLPEGEVWSWTVNRRLQGLLAVTLATRGEYWTLTADCIAAGCGEPMDLPLRLSAFRRTEDPLRIRVALADGAHMELSLPTGEDQRAWLREAQVAPQALLQRLLVGSTGDLPPAAFPTVEAALAEADPLTALEIETRCPVCGADNWIPLDLEQLCLRLLVAEQPRLLDDIHRLALAYHWSEAEILAVPAARRRQYLARLEPVWP
jgi:hypothetical protein